MMNPVDQREGRKDPGLTIAAQFVIAKESLSLNFLHSTDVADRISLRLWDSKDLKVRRKPLRYATLENRE